MEVEASLAEILIKVAMFVLVQVLVYAILSNSSNIFSKDKTRSFSFKPARSLSIRGFLDAISDIPLGSSEPSPLSRALNAVYRDWTSLFDHPWMLSCTIQRNSLGWIFTEKALEQIFEVRI